MDKLDMHSPDLTARNIDRIAELFPSVMTEDRDDDGNVKRAIDFDLLRQELSDDVVDGPRERYQLDWPGKRQALLAANTPIDKTLRPVREESVNFDTTKNIFIEGDNLDALKLLQESYLGKVKLIYIDPPYNTGNDFIYKDNFTKASSEYMEDSGQVDEEGNRLVANTEANGRFHSDWLSMMYPRLKLARNLLREDGVLLVSIDDTEVASLRFLLDEIYGEKNFIAAFVWEKGRKNDAQLVSVGHEYIIAYARSRDVLRERGTRWREEKPGAREIWDEYERLRSRHGSDSQAIEEELTAWFARLPKSDPSKKWARYRRVDENGPWRDRDISWPGSDGPVYDVIHPVTGRPCKVPDGGWRYSSPEEMQRQIARGAVVFREDDREPPFRKAHLRPTQFEDDDVVDDEGPVELANQVRGSYFYKQAQPAVAHLRELMGSKVFNNPKDHVELARLFNYVIGDEPALIADFFAGSGSSGEAVYELCAQRAVPYQFLLVQLPEDLNEAVRAAKGSAKTTIRQAISFLGKRNQPANIAELTKNRLRLAAARLAESGVRFDQGMRVFRVDTTNLAALEVAPADQGQGTLDAGIERIKVGRSSEDLLFEIFLDWGIEPSLPVERAEFDGTEVFVVDSGALIGCFAPAVGLGVVREVAARKPLRAVFRSSAFASDADRINAEQIFAQLSPATVVKTI